MIPEIIEPSQDWECSEKYNVMPSDTKYTTVKGSRSFDTRCLRWFRGPMSIVNPNITSKLPRLKASANLCGLNAINGSVQNATKKHTAAPTKHPPNPNNLSHLDNANHASSSLLLSVLLNGM